MERRNGCSSSGKLFVVGIGPGSRDYITPAVIKAIKASDIVVGYENYISLIEDLLNGKKVIKNGMKGEIERVKVAINYVMQGHNTSLISRGDPGVYGMAGLVIELCKRMKISIDVEIIPGITAANAAAALLGAPLMCDYAVISLSDLLVSWEKIRFKLISIAKSDFVAVIYNPKSKKRDWQINKAQELILEHRDGSTPVAIVTGAMRENQNISFTTLELLDEASINMQTVVFIGSSASLRYLDFLFTPRGYGKKYEL